MKNPALKREKATVETISALVKWLEKNWRKNSLNDSEKKSFQKALKKLIENKQEEFGCCVFWHINPDKKFNSLLKTYGFHIPNFYSIIVEKNYCGVSTRFKETHCPITGQLTRKCPSLLY